MPFLAPNGPRSKFHLVVVKLSDPFASAPDSQSGAAAVRHRLPPLLHAGELLPAAPSPNRAHLEVERGVLVLFPLSSLAAGGRTHRETDRRRLLCSWLRPGAYLQAPKSFQGPRCKISFSFSFVFKNSKLVKSI